MGLGSAGQLWPPDSEGGMDPEWPSKDHSRDPTMGKACLPAPHVHEDSPMPEKAA